ncbi:MAG TPA: tetratricopeptide repeat protein [Chloroflexi bacterium]|nr:tetratricopeptide repeat protein [Chloroflexota bacterium]
MGEKLEVRFLGGVEILRNGQPVTGMLPLKALALLCYLLVTNRPHSRVALAGLLWGEKSEASALTNLRQALTQIRRVLSPYLRISRHTVAFNREAPYWADVEAFEEGIRSGEIGAMKDALALYRGNFLEGFFVRDAPAFDEWAALRREYFHARALEALRALTAHHLGRGEYPLALHYVDRLLALDPWHESAHRQRMLLLARMGRYSEALAQYEACRRILAEEFGVEPSAETQRLYERILVARRMHRRPLPAQPTPFVGREAELDRLSRLLLDPTYRLLTLIGPGGIGKTRLALRAAERCNERFLHGVHFVPLNGLSSATLLPTAILERLGAPARGGTGLTTWLLGYLQDKEMLLILDGFEHLLEGATLLARILETAPDVKFLVTSRKRLGLRWEHLFPVGGLEIPPQGDEGSNLRTYSAARLFLQTAHRVHPDFSLDNGARSVARICRLVGGSPLGIELAASWVQALPVEEIAQRVEQSLDFLTARARDIPPRHRSLRAVFDSSWLLLSEEEQRVFRALSVFRGGFSSEAGAFVARSFPTLLVALEEKSLLHRTGPNRYEVHELLRQYAEEKLREHPEEEVEVRDRHCAYYALFLHDQEARLRQGERRGLEQIAREIDNVRAGWEWAIIRGRVDDLGKAVGMLARFYEVRGWFQDGALLLGKAVDRLRGLERTEAVERALGRLLSRQGFFVRYLGDQNKAYALLKEGLAIALRVGDRWEVGFALNNLGILAAMRGDFEEQRRLFLESLAHYRAAGDRWLEAIVLNNLGIAERLVGKYEEAERFSRESLRLSREIGARRSEARALQNLALVAHGRGNYAEAKRLHQESLAILREEGDLWGTALALGNLGEAARLLGEHAEARRYLEESLDLRRQIGDRSGIAIALSSLGSLARAEGKYPLARQRFGEALRLALEVSAIPLALDVLVEFAEVLIGEGKDEKAVEVLSLPLVHPATEAWVREKAETLLQEIASRLPPEVVAEAQERGKRRTIEAVAEAFL